MGWKRWVRLLAMITVICILTGQSMAVYAAEGETAGTGAVEQTEDTEGGSGEKEEAVTQDSGQKETESGSQDQTAGETGSGQENLQEPAAGDEEQGSGNSGGGQDPAGDGGESGSADGNGQGTGSQEEKPADPSGGQVPADGSQTSEAVLPGGETQELTGAGEEQALADTAADAAIVGGDDEEPVVVAGTWIKRIITQKKNGKKTKVTKWQWRKADGTLAKNEFITDGEYSYYFGSDRYMATGWRKIGGKYYYCNPGSNSTLKGVPKGAVIKGWLTIPKTVTKKVNKKKKKVTTYTYYYLDAETGARYQGGWREIDGKTYYFSSAGKLRNSSGWFKLNKAWYYLVKDGETGHPALATGWRKIKSKWYWLNPDKGGKMATGWLTQNGEKYYLNSSGAAVSGVNTISKKKYLFAAGEHGRPVLQTGSGRTEVGSKTYYFNADNSLKTGWITEEGKTYYFNTAMATGWRKINKKWYWFDSEGVRKTGWLTLSGKTYYLKSNGVMVTGWQTIDGAKYYFRSSGAMAVNAVVDGMQLGADGKMTGPAPDAMDKKAQGYSSSTRYLILVNRKSHKVGIYQGSKGKWVRVKRWSCGDGAKSTPTPEGSFRVGAKMKYFDTASNNRCWYATQFWGDYLFHSVLYVKSGSPSKVRGSVNGQLGRAVSHGCVRLTLANAKWMYSNIPSGTKVIVYH